MKDDQYSEPTDNILPILTGSVGLFLGLVITQFVDGDPPGAQIIGQYASTFSSFALLVVTYIYVQETRQTRKQEFEPYLVFELSGSGSGTASEKPLVTNIGNGPAMNINIRVSLHGSGEEQIVEHLQLPHLRPGSSISLEKSEFRLLAGYNHEIYSKYDEVTVEGQCDGISSTQVRIDHATNIEDLERIFRKSGRMPLSIGEE